MPYKSTFCRNLHIIRLCLANASALPLSTSNTRSASRSKDFLEWNVKIISLLRLYIDRFQVVAATSMLSGSGTQQAPTILS